MTPKKIFENMSDSRRKYIIAQAICFIGENGFEISSDNEKTGSALKGSDISATLRGSVLSELSSSKLGRITDSAEVRMNFDRNIRRVAEAYVREHSYPESLFCIYDYEVNGGALGEFPHSYKKVAEKKVRHIILLEESPFCHSKVELSENHDLMSGVGYSQEAIEMMKKTFYLADRDIVYDSGGKFLAQHLTNKDIRSLLEPQDIVASINAVMSAPSPEIKAELTSERSVLNYIDAMNTAATEISSDITKLVSKMHHEIRSSNELRMS